MRTILALSLLVAPATALAQETSKDVTTMPSDDCARARKAGKTCVLTIEEEGVTGTVAQSSGEKITAIEWGKMTSLITVRRDFIAEIVKTAEDL